MMRKLKLLGLVVVAGVLAAGCVDNEGGRCGDPAHPNAMFSTNADIDVNGDRVICVTDAYYASTHPAPAPAPSYPLVP